MCDPLTLIGAAASIGGTAMNAVASSRVEAARDDALAAERIRQRKLNNEADDINRHSQNRYKKFDKKQERTAEHLGDYYKSQDVPEPSKEAALPTSNSDVTIAEENKQRSQATDFTNRTGDALGTLRAFGDRLGNTSLLQARDAGTIGQIANFKEFSSNVLPLELDDASHAGDGMKLFADILGGAGGLVMSKGLSSAAPFKADTTLGNFLGGTTVSPAATPIAPALTRAQGLKYGGLSSLYGVP